MQNWLWSLWFLDCKDRIWKRKDLNRNYVLFTQKAIQGFCHWYDFLKAYTSDHHLIKLRLNQVLFKTLISLNIGSPSIHSWSHRLYWSTPFIMDPFHLKLNKPIRLWSVSQRIHTNLTSPRPTLSLGLNKSNLSWLCPYITCKLMLDQ